MAHEAVTRCLGLITQYNPLQTSPGALEKADNCIIDRENIVEDRRGYQSLLTLSNSISQLLVYQSTALAHNGTVVSYNNNGSPANFAGSYNAPSGKKMRGVEAFSNFYVTTDQGVQVFTDVAGTQARKAGAPRPLDITATLTQSSSGCLPAGNECAYRSVIKRVDANNNNLFSYPSNRTVATNPTYSTTGNIANASNQLTNLASMTGIVAGQAITGAGIPVGTTVSSLSGSTVTMSQNASLSTSTPTGSTTSGSNVISSLSSIQGITVGMTVAGTGIPASTTVTAVNVAQNSLSLSANATATGTGVVFTFSQPTTAVSVIFGQSANPTLKCYLPAEVTTSDLVQVYRTATVYTSDPGDEMALVYQINPTSTDITNGYVSFTDVLFDAMRGAALYTSPSQLGITGANDRPPLCKDVCLYKTNFMMFANTSTKERLFFSLVGVSGLSGKTITLSGVTFTFGGAENAATGTAAIGATGVTAADIESTARSLVRVINQYASNTSIYAYYQSGPQDPPGLIMCEERGIGAAAFTLQAVDAATAAEFSPQPPVGPATSAQSTSSNQIQKNAIFFSQFQQPEAVPGLNSVIAGAANKEILRIAPLRNSLIIIKEEGIYRMTGDSPQNFLVTPLDLTVFCKSPDSVAVIANTVVMLSNQGIVQITETAVSVISREIEPNIRPLLSFTNIATLAIGCGYESDRAYLISLPTLSTDSAPNQIFRFNIFTRTWTHWTFGFGAAIVEPKADIFYFSKPGDVVVNKERKSFTDADYADPEVSITITALNSLKSTITFSIAGAVPAVGWAISQGGVSLPIQSVTGNQGVYTAVMQSALPTAWSTGAALIFPSVGYDVIWSAWVGEGGAGLLKQASEIAILTDPIVGNNTATALTPTFRSNFDISADEIDKYMPGGTGWGDSWGAISWGGVGDIYGYREFVPRNKQMCAFLKVGLKHKNALEKLPCAGFAIEYEMLSERIGT